MVPSFTMRLATWVLRHRGKALAVENLGAFRHGLLTRTPPVEAPVPASLRRLCDVREENVHGQRVYTLSPQKHAAPVRVIYLHGGAYVNPMRVEHWSIIQALVERTGASFTIPLYPLAPENNHRVAFDGLHGIYEQVCAETPRGEIVLAGDSAGGGLALAHAMRCRDEGMRPAARIILFSPWLDITMANPEARDIEPLDVMLGVDALRFCGERWAGGADPRSPHLSPLFGALGELPPIDIHQGTHDIFWPDARSLRDKVVAAKGKVHLSEYPGAFHVFVGAPFTREARAALEDVAARLRGLEGRHAGGQR